MGERLWIVDGRGCGQDARATGLDSDAAFEDADAAVDVGELAAFEAFEADSCGSVFFAGCDDAAFEGFEGLLGALELGSDITADLGAGGEVLFEFGLPDILLGGFG
jgi:hypothetical protein